jgi:cell fate (sporulation/competence/biofilm development) regulator YlbF (YheA/YmcA/DUF963 family)
MENNHADNLATVQQRTDEFIEALLATPAIRRFREAARQFETDPEVQSLLETLQRFQQAQQAGLDLSNSLQDIRDLQLQIRNHPVVQEFLSARDEAGALLQETNVAISQPLGLDFAQTAA